MKGEIYLKLPDPIVKVTKIGEAITMEAIDDFTYEKCYFTNYEVGKPLVNPRKVKLVSLKAQNITVHNHFKRLVDEERYVYIPQSE